MCVNYIRSCFVRFSFGKFVKKNASRVFWIQPSLQRIFGHVPSPSVHRILSNRGHSRSLSFLSTPGRSFIEGNYVFSERPLRRALQSLAGATIPFTQSQTRLYTPYWTVVPRLIVLHRSQLPFLILKPPSLFLSLSTQTRVTKSIRLSCGRDYPWSRKLCSQVVH